MAIYKLGDISKYVEGYVNPPVNNKVFFGGDVIGWMRVKDLRHGENILKTELSLSEEGFKLRKNDNQVFKKGSIVWSKSGSVGNAAILGIDVTANRGILNIIPNELVEKEYLYYWLIKNRVRLKRKATGAVLQHLYGPQLMSENIDLPNIYTQKKIIDIIEPVSNAIKNIDLMMDNVELTFKNVYNTATKREVRISEIAQVNIGGTPSTKNKDFWGGEIPWLNSGKLTNSFIPKNADKFLKKEGLHKTKMASRGDLLISIMEPSSNKISIVDKAVAFNQSTASIKSHFNLYFEIKNIMPWFNIIKSGSAQQSINKTDILNTKIRFAGIENKDFNEIMINLSDQKKRLVIIKNGLISLLIK